MEEMKEAVTNVIDTLTQDDIHGSSQKLLERYNKCSATGVDYSEGDKSFMCVLSIEVPIRKKSGNLFNDPRNRALNCKAYFSFEGVSSDHQIVTEKRSLRLWRNFSFLNNKDISDKYITTQRNKSHPLQEISDTHTPNNEYETSSTPILKQKQNTYKPN